MTRIDCADPGGAAALELLGQVLEEARAAGLEALIEPVLWRDGRDVAGHRRHRAGRGHRPRPGGAAAQGAGPRRAGRARTGSEAVDRVVASVGVPVLFLGRPPPGRPGASACSTRSATSWPGAAAGLAIGRAIFQEPSPAAMAEQLAEIVHGG